MIYLQKLRGILNAKLVIKTIFLNIFNVNYLRQFIIVYKQQLCCILFYFFAIHATRDINDIKYYNYHFSDLKLMMN